jgi:hypothetical protein
VYALKQDWNLNFQSLRMSFKSFSWHILPNFAHDYRRVRVNTEEGAMGMMLVHLSVSSRISRYSVLFWPWSLPCSPCEDWNLLWTVWDSMGVSSNMHQLIVTQSHSWKIFPVSWMFTIKTHREWAKGREGGRGTIIQVQVKARSCWTDLTVRLL